MKKVSMLFVAAIATGLCLVKPQTGYAQNEQGKSVVTAGAGYSLVGALFKSVDNAIGSNGTVDLKSTPVICGMYDYALADHFSIGAAFSYQSFTAVYTNAEYTNSQGFTVTGSWKDRVTRMNYAIRPLFHFGDNESFDHYAGVRLGFTNWGFTSDNPDPYYNTTDFYPSGFKNRLRVQTLYGMRYFFTDNIGVNLELAIGSPYYMMGGVNFKF